MVANDVHPAREQEFLRLTGELHRLVRRKGYGSDQLLRDEANPHVYYDVRTWTSAEAAARCHADPDVHLLWVKLAETMTLRHLVNGAVPVSAEATDTIVTDAPGAPSAAALSTAELVRHARRAREHAEARFSNFKVGAALETAEGAVVTGCNVENVTYGLTICAERTAMFKAISEGHRAFARIAVVADTSDPTPPCGACRQILWEFGGDLEVILANLTEEKGVYRLAQLLPLPFDARLLR